MNPQNYEHYHKANLAAFLTVTQMEKPIQSFQDLSLQTDMLYGTVSQTSIHDYLKLKANQDDTSQWSRLWKVVNSTKISTAEEGFKKVHEQGQKFAFLWDVAIIEYKILTDEDCSLTTVKVCVSGNSNQLLLAISEFNI